MTSEFFKIKFFEKETLPLTTEATRLIVITLNNFVNARLHDLFSQTYTFSELIFQYNELFIQPPGKHDAFM